MARATVAATIIAKNEEENLPRLFASLSGAVDQIYLTDTGSTDKTVEVAKSLGAVVSHFEWVDDFSAARNFNLDQCIEDFSLFIDCDDVLEDKEAFILFRDNVMDLADYHIAPYHYSSNAEGKPVCTFARERLFRVSKGFRWRYFVHEGVIPQSAYGEVRSNFCSTWAIRHMRSDQDLLKDRSRNIKLFERHKDMLDPRMRYYYGKELFENGNPVDAVHHLLKASSEQNLEMHDRVLAIQYACYSYMQCNQFERAMELAHQGLMLAPQRAEFHCIIGDCYLKLGQIVNATPYFWAAKGCTTGVPQGFASAIFHQIDSYTSYPRNQLARIAANTADFDSGELEARDSFLKYGSDEGKQILEAIRGHKKAMDGYRGASPCEDIVITTGPTTAYVFDSEIAKQKAMGGSETAAIEMAYHLRRLSGRPVKVFNMRDEDKVCDGVEYLSTSKLTEYMSKHKPYLHIAWRHTFKVTDAPTFVWSHDLQTPGVENTSLYEKVLCLTPFHKRYMQATQGVPSEKIHVTRNGIKPERFQDGPWEKEPFRFVFPNSPDRGLVKAIRVLDKVREEFPEVTLHIHYGWEHLEKWGLGHLAKQLEQMVSERKSWITYHGATQQDKLMESFKRSAYWVSPSDFIETSMISAMELLGCGVYPIVRKVGGVVDTLQAHVDRGMGTFVDSVCETESQYELYSNAVKAAIRENAYERVKIDTNELSWERVAQDWLKELPKLVEEGSVG